MMTNEEKEQFKSNLEKYGVPAIVLVDLAFFATTTYGSIVGYSHTVMIFLTIFSFIGFHATYRALMGRFIGLFRPVLNLNARIFRIDPDELVIYDFFGVKSWKDKVPAWNKTHFMLSMKDVRDIKKVDQVLRYNVSAEITHHLNFYTSLFGTLFCLFKGMQGWWWLFGILSLMLGLIADMPFIMIQRYNRARVYPIYQRLEEKALKEEISSQTQN